jgi:undecaprenyl-diphosphatase
MDKTKQTITTFFKRYTAPKLIIAFVLFWTPVVVFLKIAGEILERQPIGIDISILHWIHSTASPVLDSIFLFITTMGNVEYILPITVVLILFLLYKKQRLNALIVTFGMGGAAAANFVLKLLFHRDRPAFWHSLITETGYSFPSGHAMLSSALILCVIAIVWNTKWRIFAIVAGTIVIGLIGYSRLYMGVHYPTDIIAGWSVSAAWIAVVLIVTKVAAGRYHCLRQDRPVTA